MAEYYIEEFNGGSGGWQGYNYYKYSRGISQGPYVDTSILMTLSKTINPNGTLYYGINWLNQVYSNMGKNEPTSGLYWDQVYGPKIDKLTKLSPTDGNTFQSTYNSLYNYIYSQASTLINSETATLYQYRPTPTYMSNSQPFWYLSNSKTNGSMLQVTWDSKQNANLMNLSLAVGSYNQAGTNPIKRSFEWYNSKSMEQMGDPYAIFPEIERFDSILKESVDPFSELIPVWPIDEGGLMFG